MSHDVDRSRRRRVPTDTRQRLLDVAMALISQHGFAGTSLQMIADELGFTKAAICYHFRTRDQLLIAVVAGNRSLAAVMVFDPSVHRVQRVQSEWGDLIERQLALLMQLESGRAGAVKATAVFTGLAGAASGAQGGVDEGSLVEQLCDIGRRILGLRQPRGAGANP